MAKSLMSLWKIIKYLRDDRVDFSKKLLFFVPIIYLIFPFDLIGDFFPLAGQLDDVAVFIIMWPILRNLLAKYNGNINSGHSDPSNKKKDRNTIDIDKNDYEVK